MFLKRGAGSWAATESLANATAKRATIRQQARTDSTCSRTNCIILASPQPKVPPSELCQTPQFTSLELQLDRRLSPRRAQSVFPPWPRRPGEDAAGLSPECSAQRDPEDPQLPRVAEIRRPRQICLVLCRVFPGHDL